MGKSQTIVAVSPDDSDPREPSARCERCGTLGTVARATLHSEPPLTLRYCAECWPIVQGELQARQKEEWHEDFARIAADIRTIAEEMSGVMPEEVEAFLERHLPDLPRQA